MAFKKRLKLNERQIVKDMPWKGLKSLMSADQSHLEGTNRSIVLKKIKNAIDDVAICI